MVDLASHETQGPPVRLRKLISWGLIGQATYILSQFIVLLALARLSTVEAVGAFGLASAISLPIVFFFNLGLRINWATDIEEEYNFSDFLMLRTIACLLSYALIIVLGMLFLEGLTLSLLLVFGLAKTIELYNDFFYGVFQRVDAMRLVARSQMTRGILSSVGFGAVLYQSGSVTAAFFVQLVVWTIVAFLIDLPKAKSLAQRGRRPVPAKWENILVLARTSLPLGVNGGLAAVQSNIPRYAISFWLGLTAVGHFTVVSYAMQAMNMLFHSVSSSVQSRIGVYISKRQRAAFYRSLTKLITISSIIGIAVSVIGFIFGDTLLTIFFGQEYDGFGAVLSALLIASTVHAILLFLQVCILANRQFYAVMIVRMIFLVVMLVTCATAAAISGLIAVSIAIIITLVLQAFALFALVRNISFP